MKITFRYDKPENIIYSTCPEVLTNESIRDYFDELISKNDEIKNAHAIVDFTGIKKFNSTFHEFKDIKHLYEDLVKYGSIKKTTFKVGNAQQRAMAKMYIVSFASSPISNQFDYDIQEEPAEQAVAFKTEKY